MKTDFSECKLLSREEIAAEEMATALKMGEAKTCLLFGSDLTTEAYRDFVLDL